MIEFRKADEAYKQATAHEIIESTAGLIGIAASRATDKQAFYDDLGALASLINGFRQDLRTVHKVKA